MQNKLLEIKSLSAGYNGDTVLSDIDLEVFNNDFIGVIGPNGGGKTTLVRIILGLHKPSKGKLSYLFDQKRYPIGYLPQIQKIDYRFPISVLDIIISGIKNGKTFSLAGVNRKNKERAYNLLEEMGLTGLADRAVGELSGGQLQRVFLCRAIISEPQLLILDEPDTFVDNTFEHDLYLKLKELNERMAIILVSHDVGTITTYIKTIACVNKKLHYHKSNVITNDELQSYDCPIQMITHGNVPHTVLHKH